MAQGDLQELFEDQDMRQGQSIGSLTKEELVEVGEQFRFGTNYTIAKGLVDELMSLRAQLKEAKQDLGDTEVMLSNAEDEAQYGESA